MLKQKITGVDNGGGMILRERPRANIELLGKLNTKLTCTQIHVFYQKE